MTDPQATVVVVNYNGAHLLPQCLDALDAQREASTPFETIVVDNASTDESLVLLEEKYSWVRVLSNSENLGFAGGNNVALATVTTPYVVLLNNDATPQQHWLHNLIEVFRREDSHDIGIVTGKIVFMPRFARVRLETPGFIPSSADTRELGARIYRVAVDGHDVSEKVLWADSAYGAEGHGDNRFRWTRPSGEFLVPIDVSLSAAMIEIAVAAENEQDFTLTIDGASTTVTVGRKRSVVKLKLPADSELVDVVNNAGGVVYSNGAGGDRGFQQIDRGQFDQPCEVFTACGNGMAMRTAIGAELGWFDDRFFMYYEDTDLSWRWRSRGWAVYYQPEARLRHIHSASSKEWSPRWVFHVERNRLLMLTKNADRKLALRAVFGFLGQSAAAGARDARTSLRQRRRPPLRSHLLRARVMLSYLRLLPGSLRARRDIGRSAVLERTALQAWLVKSS